MKTFFNAISTTSLRAGLWAVVLCLTAPLMLPAQNQGNVSPSDPNPMLDSLNRRLDRRMAEVQDRIKAMQDYIAQAQPGDEDFIATPDIPNMFDEDFFEDIQHRMPDMDDLRDQLDNMPPLPDFDFNFDDQFLKQGEWNHFFQDEPGHNGMYIYIEQSDSADNKPGKKVKKFIILRGDKDTITFEGNHNLIYSITDDNGHFTIKSLGPDGDTLMADTTGSLYYAWRSDGKPGKHFAWKNAGKNFAWSSPDDDSFKYNYQFKNRDFGSAPLSDLSADDISRLKRTELKPAKKVIPLGIDDLKVNIMRESNQLRLRFSAPGDGDLSVQLFDENGTLFHDEYLRKNNGRYDNRISLPDNEANTIFLRITRGKQSLVKKLDL